MAVEQGIDAMSRCRRDQLMPIHLLLQCASSGPLKETPYALPIRGIQHPVGAGHDQLPLPLACQTEVVQQEVGIAQRHYLCPLNKPAEFENEENRCMSAIACQ